MADAFETQYNKNAKEFTEFYLGNEAHQSTDAFFKVFSAETFSNLKNKKVLDLGCGPGADAAFYASQGFSYYGLDASKEMCGLAQQSRDVVEARNESFSGKTSYGERQFGLVVSKYAMQTASRIQPIYEEVHRLLDDKGLFCFLVVHPFRQFLEKKKQGKDYFKSEVVKSVIYGGKIIVSEPTHTLAEYLSRDFLEKFSLIEVREGSDFPNSEQIGGDIYPTFLIVVAQKK